MQSLSFAGATLAVGLSFGLAQAATMTFDGIGFPTSVWTENGITAAGNGDLNAPGLADVAHLDDGGTPSAGQINFTTGGIFSAVSFDLIPSAFVYLVCDENNTTCGYRSFANVLVQGFRGGLLVSQLLFDMGAVPSTVVLGSPFARIDVLAIGFGPLPPIGTLPNGGTGWCDSPCSHYSIDNVTLAPVPVGGTMGLLAGALGLVGALRRRQAA